jgi:hypothetical protein
MEVMRTRLTVAPDGNVVVPVGTSEAGTMVDVVVTSARGKRAADMTQDEWVDFVRRTAGSIGDPTFCRPEQLPISPAPEFN